MAGQSVAFVIENEAAFLASLRSAVAALEVKAVGGLHRLGIETQNEARRYCPVDTGRLRSSIRCTAPAKDLKGWYVEVGTNVQYAALVEFGTRRMRAQPYLRPGLLAAARKGIRS